MHNILIDCGGNQGQGFDHLKNILNINENWDVIIFEPNPNCIEILNNKFKDNPKIKILNEAVYIKDDILYLYGTSYGSLIEGATIKKEFHNSLFWDLNTRDDGIKIKCINLIEYINNISHNNIYLKLDVEGCEFEIMEELIKHKVINKIKKIFIEFHDNYSKENLTKKYDLINRKNIIIKYMDENLIDYQIWF